MISSFLFKWLSWVWPVRSTTAEGRHGKLEVRWEYGRKVLNAAQSNQSFGSLHTVMQHAFKHLELDRNPPKNVLLLGLGGGSVVHILRKEFGLKAPITAVEIDPTMIHLARTEFQLDSYADLKLVQGDAIVQIHAIRDRFDLVVVDLFADLDLAHGVDTSGFAHALRDRCGEDGILCFNAVAYDPTSAARCERVKEHLTRVFHSVEELNVEEVNRVFIAR